MKQLKDAKEIYDNIEIPKELNDVVKDAIKKNERNEGSLHMKNKNRRSIVLQKSLLSAAAVLLCFTLALNTSEVFAENAGDVPVLGVLAKVLTVRTYETTQDNKNISVKVPEINSSESNEFVTDINKEINVIVDAYTADAQSRLEADKEAFLTTGGTEEEWAERDLDIHVDYEVKYQKENLLSLVLTANESWYGAYDLTYYYNINLEEDKNLTLEDVLGSNYITIANESIISEMKARVEENSDYVYWGVTDEEDSEITGFTSVDENTKFYLNEEGKVVISFDKYEVAPGFMGKQEFIIN
ncbi:MAG: hypothetical protein K0R00_1131 [Herbinix sp.]|jgi:hypothetical protein|nr:hypothetical protein [Herbinix sp.]